MQKEKFEKAEDAKKKMKPAAALGAPPSIPLMPTCSTPVSSPQSTPVPPQSQADSSFENPHSNR